MNKLVNRVFCPECGAIRIRQPRSRYADLSQRAWPPCAAVHRADRRKAVTARLPRARRVGRNTIHHQPARRDSSPIAMERPPSGSARADSWRRMKSSPAT